MSSLASRDKATNVSELRRQRVIERAVAAVSLVSTICFGLLTWWNTHESERSHATTEFFKILQDPDSPAYLQAASLTMLAERRLISYDMAFLGAYQLEQRYSEAILTPLVFAFSKSRESITRPIGYVDLPVATSSQECDGDKKSLCFNGWAFDSNTDMNKMVGYVWLNNVLQKKDPITFEAEKDTARIDIQHLFREKRSDADQWKYSLRLKLPLDSIPSDRDIPLRVRLQNKGFEFTDIISAKVRLVDGVLKLSALKTDIAEGAVARPDLIDGTLSGRLSPTAAQVKR